MLFIFRRKYVRECEYLFNSCYICLLLLIFVVVASCDAQYLLTCVACGNPWNGLGKFPPINKWVSSVYFFLHVLFFSFLTPFNFCKFHLVVVYLNLVRCVFLHVYLLYMNLCCQSCKLYRCICLLQPPHQHHHHPK